MRRSDQSELHIPECMVSRRHMREEYLFGQFYQLWTLHSMNWLSRGLATELKPVSGLYAEHTIKDSFEFSRVLEEFVESNWDGLANTIVCSFDISSLFTNIRLQKTIQICLVALNRDYGIKTLILLINSPGRCCSRQLLKSSLASTECFTTWCGIGVALGASPYSLRTFLFVIAKGNWSLKSYH